jgi:pyruvate/2-oxoglutarate dehydrogenase complex dihydrolipoamide dehydrogenase (E3) component
MEHVDRAIVDGETEGFVKVLAERGSGRVVGATIVAPNAGDLISEITLAMVHGVGLGGIANVIHPYPTMADAIRKIGDQYNKTRLSPRVKEWMRRYLAWRF